MVLLDALSASMLNLLKSIPAHTTTIRIASPVRPFTRSLRGRSWKTYSMVATSSFYAPLTKDISERKNGNAI